MNLKRLRQSTSLYDDSTENIAQKVNSTENHPQMKKRGENEQQID